MEMSVDAMHVEMFAFGTPAPNQKIFWKIESETKKITLQWYRL